MTYAAPALKQFFRLVGDGVAAHETGQDFGIQFAQDVQCLKSVQTGQADIEQHHGNLFRVSAVEINRFPAISG